MSSTGRRMTLAQAEAIVARLQETYFGGSSGGGGAIVVGSVRRRCETVGDIELILPPGLPGAVDRIERDTRPKIGSAAKLFDPPAEEDPRRFRLVRGGKEAWKSRQLEHVEGGWRLDLYRADRLNLGSMMLIRTGPAEFSRRFVTSLRGRGLRHEDGYVRDRAGDIVPCPTEEAAFRLAGMPILAPEDRE